MVEHLAQLGYWLANPTEKPWMTPWAVTAKDVLVVNGTPGSGNELLHLIGNLIFLGGLIGAVVLAQHAGSRRNEIKYLNPARYLQSLHVVEHLLLTISYLALGRSLGFTTLFGAASGVFASSLRVWAHLLLNLAGTYFAVRAGWAMYRQGLFSVRDDRLALRSIPSTD
jgi:hypothetical protein